MNNRAVLYLRLSKEDVDKISEGDDSASIIPTMMKVDCMMIDQLLIE